MKNSVTASIEFSFKGERYKPSITLNLDEKPLARKDIPELYHIIASANNIDPYSYEYEVMESLPIKFSDAEGLVTDFISEGKLDFDAFESAWQEKLAVDNVAIIAKAHLSIDNLDDQPDLKAALIAAYLKGKTNSN